ncbi:MAG: phosphonate C-P lyase system protein PhnG [Acidimicrobiia bacterium]|nr:phosphonate C-P lyase system protein PhnG [Acidimicrobiia bacterium]
MTAGLSPERRVELLAVADRDELIGLAERCAAVAPAPVVAGGPEVGSLLLAVREPVAGERFHLGDVLACRAEICVEGGAGWAVRLGDDRLATLAAAVCDAEVDAGRPHAPLVVELCERTEVALAAQHAREWDEVVPTVVAFEGLD